MVSYVMLYTTANTDAVAVTLNYLFDVRLSSRASEGGVPSPIIFSCHIMQISVGIMSHSNSVKDVHLWEGT